MPGFVGICQGLLVYARVCWYMPGFVGIIYARVCWYMPELSVGIFQGLLV